MRLLVVEDDVKLAGAIRRGLVAIGERLDAVADRYGQASIRADVRLALPASDGGASDGMHWAPGEASAA
jgi:hypothetical protein